MNCMVCSEDKELDFISVCDDCRQEVEGKEFVEIWFE